MDGGSDDMTLAFDLAALKELSHPDSVFTDARRWSTYAGVISEKPTYVVTNFTRKHRIRQDFFSGPREPEESLANIKNQFDSERYVYVGTNDEQRERAEAADWEYLPVEDAAEAADWELGESQPPSQTSDENRDDWP
jgi:hypothetical protein